MVGRRCWRQMRPVDPMPGADSRGMPHRYRVVIDARNLGQNAGWDARQYNPEADRDQQGSPNSYGGRPSFPTSTMDLDMGIVKRACHHSRADIWSRCNGRRPSEPRCASVA